MVSSVHTDNTHAAGAFDEASWRARCDTMAANANKGCGQVYELFVDRFSGMVDGALDSMPAGHREGAILIAREWGYASAAEIAAAPDVDGFCGHGFPDNCCPLGCDDRDWEPVEFLDHEDEPDDHDSARATSTTPDRIMTSDQAVQDASDVHDHRSSAPDRSATSAAAAAATAALASARAGQSTHPHFDLCWSFLSGKMAMLAAQGFPVEMERLPGNFGVQHRLVLRWVPTVVTPSDLAGASRQYTLEISLPFSGRASCTFAGCGFDSANEHRLANPHMEHTLSSWFSSFEFESRQRYSTYFTGRRATY